MVPRTQRAHVLRVDPVGGSDEQPMAMAGHRDRHRAATLGGVYALRATALRHRAAGRTGLAVDRGSEQPDSVRR